MSRWLNAVVTVTVPLDSPVDASVEEHQEALGKAIDAVMVPNAVASGHYELVEDGTVVAQLGCNQHRR